MMSQAQLAIKALQLAMNPNGFNMGINQGAIAGAGYENHIHYHIVPRWKGDTPGRGGGPVLTRPKPTGESKYCSRPKSLSTVNSF